MLIHEKLPQGAIYPQLTQFPAKYPDFLAAFRGGQTVDNNTFLTTGDAVQTHLYKAALASGHLTTKGNPIQGDCLVDIFLTDEGAEHILTPQDRQFCRMAVDLAHKSVAENDGELHPHVGAVVVKEGKVLATGFRGETGEGRHAEFCALKKINDDVDNVDLSDCTVYTTLEPCSKRKSSKTPCTTRLINGKVARVVSGMADKDESVYGHSSLAEAGIEIRLFPKDLMQELIALNRRWSDTRRKPEVLTPPNDTNNADKQPSPQSRLDWITEAIRFNLSVEATKPLTEEVQSIDPQLLRWYRGNGSVNTVDNLPAEYYETAWNRTFGNLLICDAKVGLSAALDVVVSRHPFISIGIANNSLGGVCKVKAVISAPPMTGGASFVLAGDGEPRFGYILDLPITREVFGLRFYMTAQQLRQLAQGYQPLWKSFAIDDPEETITLNVYRKRAAEWTPIPKLISFLPSHITLKTDLLFGGPKVIREYTLSSNMPRQIGRGDDASQIYIWAFTWNRTGYRQERSDFAPTVSAKKQ